MIKSFKVLFLTFVIAFAFYSFLFAYSKYDKFKFKKQIADEYHILKTEYEPVLNYLAKYKLKNGVYPDNIDNIVFNFTSFEKFEYSISDDKKGYYLIVYPFQSPIEFYYNEKHENGYKYYENDGVYDDFLDNENFIKVDDNWHAIKYDLFSRHNKVLKR